MKERMIQGLPYKVNDDLLIDLRNARRLTRLYNSTTEEETDHRKQILRELLGSMGENIMIEPTFRCDYGSNIHIGNNFYANFDCIILDVCPVTIGENVMFGPRVCVYSPGHPIDAGVRADMLELAQPVTIGNRVWIGGSAVINGDVTIGDDTIIGSGSVVTKSIPSGVIAAGNPCRVIREITDEDTKYWQEQKAEFELATNYREKSKLL